MKLTHVHIKNFKSIDDSSEFSVDQVTCLVGKNEAGKSAVLDAIYKLNPVEANKANFTEYDFPRRRIKRDFRGDDWKQEPAISTTWTLEESDIAAADKRFGFNPFRNVRIGIAKGYDNKLKIDFEWDETAVIKYFTEQLHAEETAAVADVMSVDGLIVALNGVETPSERQRAVAQALQKDFPAGNPKQHIEALVVERIPKILKFSEYYRLPGRVAINDLKPKLANNTATFNEKVFIALLDLAGTKIEELTNVQNTEQLFMQLDAISVQLTDQIFEYWKTNSHLEVRFDVRDGKPGDPGPFNSGTVFHTRIVNRRHRAEVEFDERSSGFIWFFSFLVWFSQVKKFYGQNLLILLDEPGLTLHGKAQADLLRYFNEQLRPSYQLLYTTHSPFMVDPDYLMAARTVEDRSDENNAVLGTKVEEQSLRVERDTVLPLLGALGIGITQTLFVGKHTLLVEGSSDLLYLKWFSYRLKAQKRTGLDIRWTISPVGGISKVAGYATLFSSQALHLAVLTDFKTGDKGEIDRLRKGDLLKMGHVLSAEKYAHQAEADTEDIIGRPFYVKLLNTAYGLKSPNDMPAAKPADAPIRVVKEAENHFRVLPPGTPEFDHFFPAAYLMENPATFSDGAELNEALSRFEALFKDLNSLLPTA